MDVNNQEVIGDVLSADDLLGELVLGEASADEIIAGLDDDSASAIEILNERSDAIEGQTSVIEADTETSVETPAADPAKTPKTPKTPKAAKPKVERDLSALGDEFFQLDVNAATADKAAVIALRPTQKKVAEKFDNLFVSVAAGKKPSVYTMACFALVAEKGEVTSTDLVAALKATASRNGGGYNDGTARSQAGQLMNLFSVVGIASRDGNKLTFNKDSKIAARLQAL